VSWDPHPSKQAPRKALYAPLAASTPLAGASRRPEPLSGPQAGAQTLAAVQSGLEPAHTTEETP
jgi:hypothetical protein